MQGWFTTEGKKNTKKRRDSGRHHHHHPPAVEKAGLQGMGQGYLRWRPYRVPEIPMLQHRLTGLLLMVEKCFPEVDVSWFLMTPRNIKCTEHQLTDMGRQQCKLKRLSLEEVWAAVLSGKTVYTSLLGVDCSSRQVEGYRSSLGIWSRTS